MKWTCPVCSREFKAKNQWHSCYTSSIDEHFANKPEWVIESFNRIVEFCARLGEIEINPVKSSIQLRIGATFLGIRLKRTKLELEFFSKAIEVHKGIIKSQKVSANRVFNVFEVKKYVEVNDNLFKLIEGSYLLVKAASNQIN